MSERRTADGEPLEDRGIVPPAADKDARRAEDLQGDDDFEQTNASGEELSKVKGVDA